MERKKVKSTNLRKTLIIASLTAVLAFPAIASAGNDAGIEPTSVKVSFADLDISNAHGISALYKRLQNASEDACGPISYSETANLSQLTRNKACYHQALTSAVEKVDNDALSELHSS